MYEPVVTLTDAALALLCAGLAMRMRGLTGGGASSPKSMRRWAVAFFASVGGAAMLGAIVHGFAPDAATPAYQLLWRATLMAIGVAGTAAWCMAILILAPSYVANRLIRVALTACVGYASVVVLVASEFIVAIAYYVPAMLALLFAAMHQARGPMMRRALIGAAGIVLTFVAAWAQAARLALHAVWFDHNALYHVLQGLAMLLMFMWLGPEAHHGAPSPERITPPRTTNRKSKHETKRRRRK
jgi:hypothetical protein